MLFNSHLNASTRARTVLQRATRGSDPAPSPPLTVCSLWCTEYQGLTLVHFSAQLEPCQPHKNTLHTINTPSHPLSTGYTIPTRTPYTMKSAQVELRSERV